MSLRLFTVVMTSLCHITYVQQEQLPYYLICADEEVFLACAAFD